MIQAMYSGVSGLKAFKTKLDVIGNNIANVNTIGFKGSRVTFRDMLSQTMSGGNGPSATQGGTNPVQVGLGVTVGSIDVNQMQGSLQATGKLTDAAIEGNGFFILSTGNGMRYTRDGAFGVDGDYNLVSSSGYQLMGWGADPVTGNIDVSQQISGIRVPIGQISSAKATSVVRLGGNLNALATSTDPAYGINPSIYDSLGITHVVNIEFTRTANPGEWSYAVSSDEGTLTGGTGTIQFDNNGKVSEIRDAGGTLLGTDNVPVSLTLTADNGSTRPIDFNISMGSIGQLQGKSTAGSTYQDGLPLGTLESFTVGKDGTISGTFSNGSLQPLGRLALAEFANSTGLGKVGSNLLAESPNSGTPQIGVPGSGSRGKIASGFLESSNVDLSSEFTEMIVAQRGFQANSRIITVADQVLQELVQLTR